VEALNWPCDRQDLEKRELLPLQRESVAKYARFQLVIIDAFFSSQKSILISIIAYQKANSYHFDR